LPKLGATFIDAIEQADIVAFRDGLASRFKPSTVNSLLRIRRTLLKDAVAARDSHSSVALARSGRHDEDQAHTHGAAHDGAREDPGRASARALVHLGDRDRLSRA